MAIHARPTRGRRSSTSRPSIRGRAYDEAKPVDARLAAAATLSVVAFFLVAETGVTEHGKAVFVLRAARRHASGVVTDASETAVRVPRAPLLSGRGASV